MRMKKLLAMACLVAAALLTGCGGGIYLGYEDWDEPPAVSLVSASTSAEPGQLCRCGLRTQAARQFPQRAASCPSSKQ